MRWKYYRYTGLSKNLTYNYYSYLFKCGRMKFKIKHVASVFLLSGAALKDSLSGAHS